MTRKVEPNARCKAIREGAKELLMCGKLEGDDECGEEVKRVLERDDFIVSNESHIPVGGSLIGYLSLSCEPLAEV